MKNFLILLTFFAMLSPFFEATNCSASFLDFTLEGKSFVTEHDVLSAEALENLKTHESVISIKLDEPGTNAFKKLTGENIGKRFQARVGDKLAQSPIIRAEVGSGRILLPQKYPAKRAKEIAEALNSMIREESVLSHDHQTAFQYFGSELGHTFRIVKLPSKDFSSFAEVLDTKQISVTSHQKFVYGSEVYCNYLDEPVFAVVSKSDADKKAKFHPAQAWNFDNDKQKIIMLLATKVDCHS